MDLKGYKIKSTTDCSCGYDFTIKDMKKLQRIPETNFYGGNIKHIDEIKCPHCGRDTLLLIKQTGQTYIVKDIAQKEENIGDIEENNASNEIICPVCQKTFKNKSGLSRHMTIHNN